jgi:hypothetical protein
MLVSNNSLVITTEWTAKYAFHVAVILFVFYVLQKKIVLKNAAYFVEYLLLQFQDTRINGISDASASQIHAFTTLLLLTAGK